MSEGPMFCMCICECENAPVLGELYCEACRDARPDDGMDMED